MSPQIVRQFRQRANYYYGEILKAELQGNSEQIKAARKEFDRCHLTWLIAFKMQQQPKK